MGAQWELNKKAYITVMMQSRYLAIQHSTTSYSGVQVKPTVVFCFSEVHFVKNIFGLMKVPTLVTKMTIYCTFPILKLPWLEEFYLVTDTFLGPILHKVSESTFELKILTQRSLFSTHDTTCILQIYTVIYSYKKWLIYSKIISSKYRYSCMYASSSKNVFFFLLHPVSSRCRTIISPLTIIHTHFNQKG